jgi:hypothetical protein
LARTIESAKRSARIFRCEHEGKALRENPGLPRPENRFFSNRRRNHRRAESHGRESGYCILLDFALGSILE